MDGQAGRQEALEERRLRYHDQRGGENEGEPVTHRQAIQYNL
jgi:hypothetical protein